MNKIPLPYFLWKMEKFFLSGESTKKPIVDNAFIHTVFRGKYNVRNDKVVCNALL